MSDANRVALRFALEGIIGTAPVSPAFKTLRLTGMPSLGSNPRTQVSDELASDRNVSDLVVVAKEAGGDMNFELSYDSFTDVIEASLYNDWTKQIYISNEGANVGNAATVITGAASDTVVVGTDATDYHKDHLVIMANFASPNHNGVFTVAADGASSAFTTQEDLISDVGSADALGRAFIVGFAADSAGDIDATKSGTVYTMTSTTCDFTTFGLAAGDWLYLTGWSTLTGNNGWVRVSAIAANTLTLDWVPSGWAGGAESGTVRAWFGTRDSGTRLLAAATADDSFVVSGGLETGFVAGMMIQVIGTTSATNDGVFVCDTTGASNKITVRENLTDEAEVPASASLRIVGFTNTTAASGDLKTSVTAGTGTENGITSSALDLTTFGLAAGDWIKISGSDTAANNGWCRVKSTATNEIVLDRAPSGFAADSTATDIKVWMGDKITNGVIEKAGTLEQEFSDQTTVPYLYLTGSHVSSFRLDIATTSIITGSAAFMSSNAEDWTTTRKSGATTVATTTTDILQSSADVGRIAENGSTISGSNFIIDMSLEINNNTRRRFAVGQANPVGIGAGRCVVTGRANTYFDDTTLANKVLNNTDTSLDFVLEDADSNAFLVDIPTVNFTAGSPNVPGIDQDVNLPLDYQGIKDATLGYTIKIQQFHHFV